jgi:HlyD family secretion protein
MKKVLRIFFIVLIVGALVGTLYFLFEKNKKAPISYNTKTAEITTIIKKTVATGSIIPRQEILIKPMISGIVSEVYVEAGDYVKKGDVLAKIRVVPNMVALNNAENRVNRAKIEVENAQVDYNRNKSLYDKKVISDATFQPIKLRMESAKEELLSAENNLAIVKEGVSNTGKAASNTLIRSTIAGMVLDVPVKVGNSVIESNNFNDGTTIANIADMTDMIFEGKVDESEVGKLKEGMTLILNIGAIDSEKFEAVLEYVAPKGVEENGAIQFLVKAAVTLKQDQFVRAGYSATADVVLDRRDSVLAIEESLLQFEEDSAYIEVMVGEQQFERREVKLGLSDGIKVEVLEGVDEEDKIKEWNMPIKS